ncbi:MAG TPA: BatA domain-containing protein, partial [Gemmatimonadaceae bacterium]|nr:BatA domain-containing protein [Gemmatimonadaceae bacterium]
MKLLGGLELAAPWALLLLLLIPAWWWLRRRRVPAAITFSRAGMLARQPAHGRWVRRALFVARHLLLVGLVLALARPRTGARAENV